MYFSRRTLYYYGVITCMAFLEVLGWKSIGFSRSMFGLYDKGISYCYP